jgi:hypothetical protein
MIVLIKKGEKNHNPLAFASKTLTASGPLFGAEFGLGIFKLPFSLGLRGLGDPSRSRSRLRVGPCFPLKRSGVDGLLATN